MTANLKIKDFYPTEIQYMDMAGLLKTITTDEECVKSGLARVNIRNY